MASAKEMSVRTLRRPLNLEDERHVALEVEFYLPGLGTGRQGHVAIAEEVCVVGARDGDGVLFAAEEVVVVHVAHGADRPYSCHSGSWSLRTRDRPYFQIRKPRPPLLSPSPRVTSPSHRLANGFFATSHYERRNDLTLKLHLQS